jgi:hypothetical protein
MLKSILRGRPASSTPGESVRRLSAKAGIAIPGDDDKRSHRESGAGATGWRPSTPVAGLVSGLAAVAASSLPMAATGVSDPREWSVPDWLGDLVPHLAYGLTTAATYTAMTEENS